MRSNAVNGQMVRLIAGMPRAGSTWLMRSLNQHPDVACFGETLFWGRGYTKPDVDGRYGPKEIRLVVAMLEKLPFETVVGESNPGWLRKVRREDLPGIARSAFAGVSSRITPGDAFERYCRKLAEAEGKTIWVEKTPHHLNWVDRILKELPAARFVLTLRDPYSFMLSYKHQKGILPEDRKLHRRLYHPIACSLVYRRYARAALELAGCLPERVLLVRLEEIQKDPELVLSRVVEFLGIRKVHGFSGIGHAVYSSFLQNEEPQLPAGDRFIMNLLCRREIERLGYAVCDAPATLGAIRPVLSFPFWAARAVYLMSGRIEGPTLPYLWRWVFPTGAQGSYSGG